MAVAVVDTGAGTIDTNSVSSITLSATVSGSANCLVVVATSNNNVASYAPTGITWNTSENLTLVSSSTAVEDWFASSYSTTTIWYLLTPTSGTHNIVVTWPSAQNSNAFAWCSLSGVDTGTPVGTAATNTSGTDTESANPSVTASGFATNDLTIAVVSEQNAASPTADQTSLSTFGNNAVNNNTCNLQYSTSTGAMTWTLTSTRWAASAVNFKPTAASLEQEGFAFGSDDGNEASHTLNTQDTNLTATLGTQTLRVLVNATLDPAALAYTLRSQKNGSGGYVAVPTVSGSSPTIGTPTAGTLAYSASGGTSVAPSYPGSIAANDTLVLIIGQKPSSANGGTATTPAGWTLQAQMTGATDGNTGGYTTTLGADTGNTNIYIYTKDSVTGSESGTLSVTVGTNNVCWGAIVLVPKTDTATWSYAADTGKDTSAGNVSIASSAGMDVSAGDMMIGAMVIPTDVTTPSQFSSEAMSQSGTTFGTMGELAEPDSTTGNDIGGFIFYQPVSSGSGSGVVTMSATAGGTTTNVRGPGVILRLRATAITNEVYVSASANVAAGGEATTARLTAPSGKTTSNFTTGRRWDDENGTDTIDIASGNYTEVEWVLTTQSPGATSDYYEFRVYQGSSALDTYTVTPKWTIGSGASGTLAYTNANDTSSASGTTTIVGTLAKTNANDTSAASGTTTVTGTLATTNANDTSAASGTVGDPVSGTLATTNADDTSSASGTTTVTGTLAKTNADDTSSASGTTTVTGTLAKTNADDTSAASGTTTIVGTLAKTNANDTSTASGTTTVTGSLATTNADDTSVASGSVGSAVSGSLATTNANDTSVAIGSTPVVSTQQGGGSSSSNNRQKYVEIKGELYPVSNKAEAELLLELYGTKAEQKKKPKIVTKSIKNQPKDNLGEKEPVAKITKPSIRPITQTWDEDDEEVLMLLL